MRPTAPFRLVLVLCLFALGGPLSTGAFGHAERPTGFPDGSGEVPRHRTDGPAFVVCKPDTPHRLPLLSPETRARNLALLAHCRFQHIQDAVNAVTQQGSRILVMPGLYREEPSLRPAPPGCEQHYTGTEDAGRGGYLMSYAEQLACPHAQNLIAVLGDPTDAGVGTCGPLCHLQIEGTGDHPNDVVVDADYSKLNGIRADRANGFGLFNLTAQRTEFNAVYILEQDGFVIDNVVTRWNYEYGFLTFSADNGLYKDCEVYGSGDAGLYPGSAADIHAGQSSHDALDPARYATVIQNCVSHHNALGYSGTAGNSVHMHDSRLVHNGIGITTDSLFPDHPGLPQDHARWENNVIAHNNMNYYDNYTEPLADGRSACHPERPYAERGFEHGVVCPNVGVPVGAGVLIAGGNWNLIQGNDIYDNWRYGGMQFNVPALLRDETDPTRQFDTSHHNHWRDNRLGRSPEGWVQPMGTDFWWDDQGTGNCWQGNISASGPVRSNTPHLQPSQTLPTCDSGGSVAPPGLIAVPNLVKSAQIFPCADFDRYTNPRPQGCPWMDDPPRPASRQPATPVVARHGGSDRIATAIELSEAVHPMTGAMAGMPHTVVLARADDYADALVAAPLAARLSGPVLLTGRDGLDARVVAELRRLNADRVVLMGGEAALSGTVAAQVRALGIADVQRVAGPTRFGTAARVARLLGGSQAYLAEGAHADPNRGWPDAVAVSGLAGAQLRPILLTVRGTLPSETAEVVGRLGIRNLSIVGGTAAVSAEVEQRVRELVPHVERLAGADRYGTAAAVAERSVYNVMDPHTVWVVTGGNWPDALTAGAAAAYQGGLVLMVPGWQDAPAGAAVDWHAARYHPTDRVHVAGGTAAVTAGMAAGLAGG